jgi:hypothetical protein
MTRPFELEFVETAISYVRYKDVQHSEYHVVSTFKIIFLFLWHQFKK